MVKIEKQKAMEITLPPLERIEYAARLCYRSQPKTDDAEKRKQFLHGLMVRGHLTPFEHAALVLDAVEPFPNGPDDKYRRSAIVTDFTEDGKFVRRLNARTLIEELGVVRGFNLLTANDGSVETDKNFATFEIITNRGIGNQLIRHRVISFESTSRVPDPAVNQESLRWVLMDDPVVVLSESALQDLNDKPDMKQIWLHSVTQSFMAYKSLLKSYKKEFARTVLPLATYTRIVMTADMHCWYNFLKLRMDKAADPQMRDLAGIIYRQLKDRLQAAGEDLTVSPFSDAV